MIKWIKKIIEEFEKPMPIDPIRVDGKVEYIGVKWIVTQRWQSDAMNKGFQIERINPLGQREVANPGYYSELVTPKV